MFGKIVFWIIFTLSLIIVTAGMAYLYWRIFRADQRIAAAILILLLFIIGYQAYDNNRITVAEDIVYIPDLPSAFEDFTILQITDLHGKRFGQNQVNLISQINALEYDMIAVTGDMETGTKSFEPFIEMLEGLKNKESVFYINGNLDLAYDSLTGQKTEVGTLLERYGCILLTEPHPIEKEGTTLWLADVTTRPYRGYEVYSGIPPREFRTDEQYQIYQSRFTEFLSIYAPSTNDVDVKVAFAHIPFTKSDLEKGVPTHNNLDFDLVIAGHYHGGQVRVPFYGAPFIPVMTSSFYDGFFPDQNYVSGLAAGNSIQQYISRGLGASNIPFRLFNTPEINLLTLKAM